MIQSRAFSEIEKFLITVGKVATLPLAPFWLHSVNAKHVSVIYRMGRVDTVKEAGLRYISPPCNSYNVFVGPQALKTPELHITDKTGTPIRVAAIFNYHVDNPINYTLNRNPAKILENRAEAVVREICRNYPMIAEDGQDLRNGAKHVSEELTKALYNQAHELGYSIDSVQLAEVNYTPEIAQQMLMKQQAHATVAARKEIVEGLVSVVKETVKNFEYLTPEEKSRLTTNLLTTMASSSAPQPVIQLK